MEKERRGSGREVRKWLATVMCSCARIPTNSRKFSTKFFRFTFVGGARIEYILLSHFSLTSQNWSHALNAVTHPKAFTNMPAPHTFTFMLMTMPTQFPWLLFICSFSILTLSTLHTFPPFTFILLSFHFFFVSSFVYQQHNISLYLIPSHAWLFFAFPFFYAFVSILGVLSCHAARPLLYVRHFSYCYCYRSFSLSLSAALLLSLHLTTIVLSAQPIY